MWMSSLPVHLKDAIVSFLSPRCVLNLQQVDTKYFHVCSSESLWQGIAVQKWGEDVRKCSSLVAPKLKFVDAGSDEDTNPPFESWRKYVQKRLCVQDFCYLDPVPLSPLHLIQEEFTGDMWHVLCACLLCSRTSGSETVHSTIRTFVRLFPTPTDILAADKDAIISCIYACGLMEERYKALSTCAEQFLCEGWQHPRQFYGCGPFTADSVNIFCNGILEAKDGNGQFLPTGKAVPSGDKSLCEYKRWYRSRQSGPTVENKAPAPTSKKRRNARPAKHDGKKAGATKRRSARLSCKKV